MDLVLIITSNQLSDNTHPPQQFADEKARTNEGEMRRCSSRIICWYRARAPHARQRRLAPHRRSTTPLCEVSYNPCVASVQRHPEAGRDVEAFYLDIPEVK